MKEEYLKKEEFKRVKTFMQGMDLFSLTLEQRQAYLADKRLSGPEKKIIEATILLRDCKYDEIVAVLKDLPVTNVLVEAQRDLILGIAYNDASNLKSAEAPLQSAIKIFGKYDLDKYAYYAISTLCFNYINSKQIKKMTALLDQMNEVKDNSTEDLCTYYRCLLHYHMLKDDMEKALSVISNLNKIKKSLLPSQLIAFLTDKFVYFEKQREFDKCYIVLEEMKSHRRFNYSLNYKFMKSMLDHVTQDKAIYLNLREFQTAPKLLLHLKVIKGLEEGDQESAKNAWAELRETNSEIFGEFLEYKGDRCLFSYALDKTRKSESAPLKQDFGKLGGIEEAILSLLARATLPVSKNEIFKFVWGGEIQSDVDMKKLSMAITRLKKKTGLEIVSRKGTYFIASNKKAS